MLDDPETFRCKTFDKTGRGTFMKHITCIDDLRALHKRRVPKAFFDYCDRGSYAEETLRANREDMQAIKFRQRILVDVSRRDTSTTILGEQSTMPLMLAPIGLLGMQHGDGEIHACRAAQAAGIPFTQSTMSICSIEDIAANVEKPFWFQLYVMKDRGFIKELVQRAIGGEVQRARAHRRSPGDRPAPRRYQERHDRSAGIDAVERSSISPPSRPGSPACCRASAAPSATSPAT